MIKKCQNCKIEFTPSQIRVSFCDWVCKKAYNQNWIYKLKMNDEYIMELIERDLQTNY